VEIRQKLPCALFALADDGSDGNHLISVSLAASRKRRPFGFKKCATNPVGMGQCAETC
jgi:hypothetical protein